MLLTQTMLAFLCFVLANFVNAKVYKNDIERPVLFWDEQGISFWASSIGCPVPLCVNSSKTMCGNFKECSSAKIFPEWLWLSLGVILVVSVVAKFVHDAQKNQNKTKK